MDANYLKEQISARIEQVSRLIYEINNILDERREDKYVPREVAIFLEYVGKCAYIILEFCDLIKRRANRTSNPEILNSLRRRVESRQKHLVFLHYFLQPIIQVSILQSPSPFLLYMKELFQRYYPEGKLVIARFEEYNYRFESLYHLNETLPNAQVANLGLIKYPFAEYRNVLGSVLIAHEVGHFLYKKCNGKERTIAAIDPQKYEQYETKIYTYALHKHPGFLFAEEVAERVKEIIGFWWEEVFADLFATRMIGPAYLYAFIKHRCTSPGEGFLKFSERHPADSYRIARITGLLREDGWWKIIQEESPSIWQWAEAEGVLVPLSEHLKKETFDFGEDPDFAEAYTYLDETVRNVVSVLEELTEDARFEPATFYANHYAIIASLKEFIPPSEVKFDKREIKPDPISVVNSAWIFYLNNEIHNWYEKSGREKNRENDCFFYLRLNEFVLKAIEDFLVVTEWEKGT